MSIPVTASAEAFTPASMADIEGAPTFTFRHATVLDKTRFHELKTIAKLRNHSPQEMRDVVQHELRKLFTSEGMEQNITRLEAYWAAIDEHDEAVKAYRQQAFELLREAGDGEMPELPPAPEIDFPKGEIIELNAMVDQVERESDIYAAMRLDNLRFDNGYPRLLMRMFLTETSLPVELKRDREGILTGDCAEAVIEALAKAARAAGLDGETAVGELLLKSVIALTLTGDEEKNSSSPRSGISSPKSSAKAQSNGKDEQSTDPVTLEKDTGSNSSDSDNPA
jgi:hypothetical protein